NGQWSMVNGQWSMVNGQWSMVNGQWSMVNFNSNHAFNPLIKKIKVQTINLIIKVQTISLQIGY
ncbi:MAG: hypothetical protein HW421_2820, partial [Ignavibacteria bacterium]|nr:hypothetical protein [Ignavibacteria bacterium]